MIKLFRIDGLIEEDVELDDEGNYCYIDEEFDGLIIEGSSLEEALREELVVKRGVPHDAVRWLFIDFQGSEFGNKVKGVDFAEMGLEVEELPEEQWPWDRIMRMQEQPELFAS